MTFTSSALSEADYISIEDALLGTKRGRAFLREYLERNRAADTHKLLRSVSKLHSVTVGEPGFARGVHRDLVNVMRHVSEAREITPKGPLLERLHQVEASLMALTEFVEDRSCEMTSGNSSLNSGPDTHTAQENQDRHAKLVGELSSFFANDNKLGPAEAL